MPKGSFPLVTAEDKATQKIIQTFMTEVVNNNFWGVDREITKRHDATFPVKSCKAGQCTVQVRGKGNFYKDPMVIYVGPLGRWVGFINEDKRTVRYVQRGEVL